MISMDFHKWIKEKYTNWSDSGKKSVSQFAAYLEISQPTVNAWIGETRGQPQTREIINKLVAKFGDEVYEVLGLSAPGNNNPGLSIPLLGRIAAGTAITMPPSDFPAFGSDSFINILRDWIPSNAKSESLFALEVEGDSMEGEGIHNGDTIIMRKVQTANNGDLVAVRLDDENSFTLKKFFRENGTVILQPANPNMQPITVPAEKVHIEGKIVISIRRFK
ncbi:hypothetical protein hrd7_25040 [Leptolinea sp. HRD-7]|nr:hypothetical protein hrd7_25040 [Leptolinea sp. HRD-7]